MKATIFSHKECIGTAELKISDAGMGCVYGSFSPNSYYYSHIQKIVWEFWTASEVDYQRWEALRFNAQLENGYFVYSAGGYLVDDAPGFPNESKRISIAGLDHHVMNFFRNDQRSCFIQEPWCPVSIEQKIAFEDELAKETGKSPKNSFLNFFKSIFIQEKIHPLDGFQYSALCKDQRNDDVLFVTRSAGSEAQFAVVHLTWKGKKEREGFPFHTFYESFEEFIQARMK